MTRELRELTETKPRDLLPWGYYRDRKTSSQRIEVAEVLRSPPPTRELAEYAAAALVIEKDSEVSVEEQRRTSFAFSRPRRRAGNQKHRAFNYHPHLRRLFTHGIFFSLSVP